MKTVNIKKTIALYSVLLLSINLSAQKTDSAARKKAMCNKIINMYKYVFEGKVISSKQDVRIRTGEHTYSKANSYLVQVQKVLKGDIQKGTIEIIGWSDPNTYYDNGEIQRVIIADGNSGDYTPPIEGIYLSYKIKNIKDSNNVNTNSMALEFDGAIPLHNGELVKEKRGISQYFATLAEFYAYISENYGVKIEE